MNYSIGKLNNFTIFQTFFLLVNFAANFWKKSGIFLELYQIIDKFRHFHSFSKKIGEIPIQFHQNLSKNHQKEFKNNEFLQTFAEKCENV